MKTAHFALLAVAVSLFAFSHHPARADDKLSSPDGIEVIIQGKMYKSIREYRLDQIKEGFEAILSSRDLQEFSEEELAAIIRKMHQEKDIKVSPRKRPTHKELPSSEEDVHDFSSEQMEHMLDDYLEGHKDIDPVKVDPGKVRHIIIEK